MGKKSVPQTTRQKASKPSPKKASGSGFSLKDELFNQERVEYLAGLFAAVDQHFNATSFIEQSLKPFPSLELKQRISHLAEMLEQHLPADFRVAAKQIVTALPAPLDPTKTDDDFGDFIFAPLGEYVVRRGIEKQYVKLSLRTLKELTKRFSMEDAIRSFINRYPELTLSELEKWSRDKNYHVRRLVSEGTRPLLPWSGRLSIDLERPLPLLDILHADPTRYVTRSVANHLNDISKTEPQQVLKILKKWKPEKKQEQKELEWMSKHALRTLVKRGHAEALKFLGFRPQPKIQVEQFTIANTKIKAGEAIEFSFCLQAKQDENLMIDYVIDFVKANGSLTPKVHKLKQLSLKKGELVTLKKRHVLRANATTYTLYPGTHQVTLQINGQLLGTESFELQV